MLAKSTQFVLCILITLTASNLFAQEMPCPEPIILQAAPNCGQSPACYPPAPTCPAPSVAPIVSCYTFEQRCVYKIKDVKWLVCETPVKCVERVGTVPIIGLEYSKGAKLQKTQVYAVNRYLCDQFGRELQHLCNYKEVVVLEKGCLSLDFAPVSRSYGPLENNWYGQPAENSQPTPTPAEEHLQPPVIELPPGVEDLRPEASMEQGAPKLNPPAQPTATDKVCSMTIHR